MHLRLTSVEAKVTAEVVHMTDDQRRQRAREAILAAFAERPMQLIDATAIDQDAVEIEQDSSVYMLAVSVVFFGTAKRSAGRLRWATMNGASAPK